MAYFTSSLEQLPPLDEDASAHAEKVRQHIIDEIKRQDGFIGFDRYMELALYTPGLGYYSAGSSKLGVEGDYVTAPLISPLFSQVLAGFMCRQLRAGDDVLEPGAGNGAMALGILNALDQCEVVPGQYNILEPSADLRERQQQTLAGHAAMAAGRVCWIDRLTGNDRFSGIVIGNEVLDAMPVKRFALREGAVYELGVGLCETGLCMKSVAADKLLIEAVTSVLPGEPGQYPDGYNSEYRPSVRAWLQSLYDSLLSGLVVLFDYGTERADYYRVDRVAGTIRGYYRHYLVEDALLYPGMMDLTASVDFTRLAEDALDAGFEVLAYTSQANFLVELGLLELVTKRSSSTDTDYLSVTESIKMLTDPGEMGEAIKVMVLGKGRELANGFKRDLRYRLG